MKTIIMLGVLFIIFLIFLIKQIKYSWKCFDKKHIDKMDDEERALLFQAKVINDAKKEIDNEIS